MTGIPGNCWLTVLIAVVLGVQPARAQLCANWGKSIQLGTLQAQVPESSGMAVSRRFPNRLYHINDSGDTGRFYVTDMKGQNTRAVEIEDFRPADAEGLSLGSCGQGATCLFVADIGDNNRRRGLFDIVVIDEVESFPKSVKPKQRIRLRYPDGPHDAEGIAVHPDGSIYILTKENPARLYRADPSSTGMLQQVMMLEAGSAPTDIAISDDGTRMLVLTYLDATEFQIDFKSFMVRARQRIPLEFLQQNESVAYLPGSRSFLYSTERVVLPAWIMRMDCGGK